jgi:hypothetical protein
VELPQKNGEQFSQVLLQHGPANLDLCMYERSCAGCNMRLTKQLHLQLRLSDTAPLHVAESACKALCQGPLAKTTPVCGLTASGQHKVFPHACAACEQGAAIKRDDDCPQLFSSHGAARNASDAHQGLGSDHAAADNKPFATGDCPPGVASVKCDITICDSVKCPEALECYLDACGTCKTGEELCKKSMLTQ